MQATRMCRMVVGDYRKLPKQVCRRRAGHGGPCDENGRLRLSHPSRRKNDNIYSGDSVPS